MLNISEDTSAWINACNGFGGIFGKPVVAFLFYKYKVHPLYAYGVLQVKKKVPTKTLKLNEKIILGPLN